MTSKPQTIHALATDTHAKLIHEHCERGANVDALDGRGYTALHHAALNYQFHAVAALLKAGADERIKTPDGKTAQALAMEDLRELRGRLRGRLPADAEVLLTDMQLPEEGFSENEQEHWTLLRMVIHKLRSWHAGRIVQAHPELELRVWQGLSALHMAVYDNDINQIQRCLEAGVNPGIKNDGGDRPLMYAIRYGLAEAAALLAQNDRKWGDYYDEKNQNVVHLAVQSESVETLRALAEAGPGAKSGIFDRICDIVDQEDKTPLGLTLGCRKEDDTIEMSRILVDHGARFNAAYLRAAAHMGKAEVCAAWIREGYAEPDMIALGNAIAAVSPGAVAAILEKSPDLARSDYVFNVHWRGAEKRKAAESDPEGAERLKAIRGLLEQARAKAERIAQKRKEPSPGQAPGADASKETAPEPGM